MTMTREEVRAFLTGDDRPSDKKQKPILSAGAMNDLLADALGQYEDEQPIQNRRARALGWRIIPRSRPEEEMMK